MSARLLFQSGEYPPIVARRSGVSAAVIAEAWRRWRTRRMLDTLDDRLLRDIGASRSEARAEASKPFWRA